MIDRGSVIWRNDLPMRRRPQARSLATPLWKQMFNIEPRRRATDFRMLATIQLGGPVLIFARYLPQGDCDFAPARQTSVPRANAR